MERLISMFRDKANDRFSLMTCVVASNADAPHLCLGTISKLTFVISPADISDDTGDA